MFLVEYFKVKRQRHRWVQIEAYVAMKIEETDLVFPKNCSCDYILGDSSVKYREYHVDTYCSHE